MAALLVAVGPASARLTSPALVTLRGIGGVAPGMTPAQVASRWGVRLRLDQSTGPVCATAQLSEGGTRGYLIFERRTPQAMWRLGAVFFDHGARTAAGIGIGSTVSRLVRAYPARLAARPDAYVPGGQNFFLTRNRKPRWRIRFDSDAKARITSIAFGARAVWYTEGCA